MKNSCTKEALTDVMAGSWTDGQVAEFAKRFAFANKACWPAYVDDVREALIDSSVLLIVLGQDRHGVPIDEIRALRLRLGARLAAKHKTANPIAEQIGVK